MAARRRGRRSDETGPAPIAAMIAFAATLFAVICLGVIGFQVALIGGAPWGRLTQGGGVDGPLPRRGRIAAALSILLILAVALAILSAAGRWPHWPAWTGWAALGVQTLSTCVNWITPSAPERRLWGPITSVMLALAALVVVAG